MSNISTSDSQLQELYACLANSQVASSLLVASTTLFFYDYCLTFGDELRFIWIPKKKITSGYVLFFLARYSGFLSAIFSLLPISLPVDAICICLRLIATVSSHLILAVRTWAIWEKNRGVTVLLILMSIISLTVSSVIVSKAIATHSFIQTTNPELQYFKSCQLVTSVIRNTWIVAYLMAIAYETVTLSLSVTIISRWRKRIPEFSQSHLLNILWNDGLIYFIFTLGLGIVNVALTLQSSSPQLRYGGTQLQTCFNSMLSTRTILHLAAATSGPKTISSCSVVRFSVPDNSTSLEEGEGGAIEPSPRSP